MISQVTLVALAACLFVCATAAPAPQCKKKIYSFINDESANVWLPLKSVSLLPVEMELDSERDRPVRSVLLEPESPYLTLRMEAFRLVQAKERVPIPFSDNRLLALETRSVQEDWMEVSVEHRLAAVSVERRLAAVSVEHRLAAVSVEHRLAAVSAEHQALEVSVARNISSRSSWSRPDQDQNVILYVGYLLQCHSVRDLELDSVQVTLDQAASPQSEVQPQTPNLEALPSDLEQARLPTDSSANKPAEQVNQSRLEVFPEVSEADSAENKN